MRPIITASGATERLLLIFPREAFDTVMSSPLAGAAVSALIYVDSIATGNDSTTFWARPSMVTWMSEEMRIRDSEDDRVQWREAAAKKNKDLVKVLDEWGVSTASGYADNSRETLRDETFRKWRENSAIREKAGVPKNSSKGRWALEPHFADLFDPGLAGDQLVSQVVQWRERHLSPAAKLKVQFAAQGRQTAHAVSVTLPNGAGVRTLESGKASLILKSVVEEWAATRLTTPYVVTISEPGDKVFTADAKLLTYLQITINTQALLPDALIADVGGDDVQFWFVEAVNTDGEINEARKQSLLTWATNQGINPAHCHFLTAFTSRTDPAARKRLKDLASGTYAYFADEPGHELAWYRLVDGTDT
ncbi:BsuBI/PstI family type II restriction endonuclease [Rhodococcus sp. 14-2470-1a]|uniref:BsuBI/PstI family type II restriction endonuclease n=1 Tax=Rhodococcus sp. 14-2470-1a TaxID=2023150 RepID=UPI00211AD8D5|nr:BsuBI/PstI family type II restriction endonuclease [Rhodococcus sp. 14-2470-1a]